MIGECPAPKQECPLKIRLHGHRSNEHHLFYPARDYTTEIEIAFRELPENKVQMCLYEHDLLHQREAQPEKPSLSVMLAALVVPNEVAYDQQAA